MLALGLGLRVHGGEGGQLHIDLAPHLDHIGPAGTGKFVRYIVDCAKIRGDVLPDPAISSRRALNENALLVAEIGGEAVDLGLCGEGDGFGRIDAQEAAHPCCKLRHQSWSVKALSSDSMGAPCSTGEKLLGDGRPPPDGRANPRAPDAENAPRWRGCAPLQGVVFRIGQNRGVVLEIEPFGLSAISPASRSSSAMAPFSVRMVDIVRVSAWRRRWLAGTDAKIKPDRDVQKERL